MTKEKLQKLGLSDKEAGVYLAVIELGPAVVSDIAKKAGVNRSTAYVVLEFLKKRGLINESDSKTAKLYNPMPPEKLVDHFEELAKQYKELAGTAKEILPELKSIRKIKKQTEVTHKVYLIEGYKNVQNVYEDTLSSLESIRAYASTEGETEFQKDLKVQVIMPNTQTARNEIAKSKELAKEAFFGPKGKYAFAPEINIYDKKVVFISPTENFALIVESEDLAKTLKKSFNLAEKEIKRMNEKSSITLRLSPKSLPG